MAKFPARLPRSWEPCQSALSYERIEHFTKDLEVKARSRKLGSCEEAPILAKQQLRTCISLFCTFLCCRCMTTTWNFLISRCVEDVNPGRLPFSLPELRCGLLDFNSKHYANIWRTGRDGISAIKFRAAWIYFLTEIFVPIAVVVA